jgi:hypothetical protein
MRPAYHEQRRMVMIYVFREMIDGLACYDEIRVEACWLSDRPRG